MHIESKTLSPHLKLLRNPKKYKKDKINETFQNNQILMSNYKKQAVLIIRTIIDHLKLNDEETVNNLFL